MTESLIKKESKAWKTKTIKDRIFEFLRSKPECNIIELYDEFKNINKNTVKVYKSLFSREIYGLKYNNLLRLTKLYWDLTHLKMGYTDDLTTPEYEVLKELEKLLKAAGE